MSIRTGFGSSRSSNPTESRTGRLYGSTGMYLFRGAGEMLKVYHIPSLLQTVEYGRRTSVPIDLRKGFQDASSSSGSKWPLYHIDPTRCLRIQSRTTDRTAQRARAVSASVSGEKVCVQTPTLRRETWNPIDMDCGL
jgi:hypothetical protein